MNFFGSRPGSNSADDAPSTLRDSLLESGVSTTRSQQTSFSIPTLLSGAPIIPGTETEGILRRETCAEGAKVGLKTFFIYAIAGLVGTIILNGMKLILAAAVIVLLVIFALLTGSGMVAINWNNVGGAMLRTVDRDGDGKIGWNDFKAYSVDLLAFLSSRGLPALFGLATGIFTGFYLSSFL